MIHALKTLPEYFEAVWENKKTFELRKNDRDFKVGDYLALLWRENGRGGVGRCYIKD